ncbi:unnamed protein product [Bursaphelenchus okinawaensis]|uniref:Uncharacterized protein n=1 Tax=Bursaphelenchus okinawaensis TaxID=465554 RepID=A0A811LMA5_9BILA|nr:unnamed protein product [Bursaphelenchus okinawaensis]CAG9126605.1 unnamed protein product [Bursaphelenchus okinawaensis]
MAYTYPDRSIYSCQMQLQGCNLLLILLGLLMVGLASSQFSPVGLDNYRLVDLRLLNYFHTLTGAVSFYCVIKNHGSIVVKGLYMVSFVVGTCTAIFYGFTTYRIVDSYQNLMRLQNTNGFQQEFGEFSENYVGKIVISAVSIGVSAVAGLVALVGLFLLDRLVVVEPNWPTINREQEIELRYNRIQLKYLALLKLFLGLGTLGLAAFLEYLHESLGRRPDYIKISLDHIASFFATVGALTDVFAVHGKARSLLNQKVGLGMAVVAAVWTIKAVDNGMFPFYKDDIRNYYALQSSQSEAAIFNSTEYVIVIVHGVLLSTLAVLFFVCAFSAVLSGCCLQRDAYNTMRQLTKEAVLQSRFLGFIHVFWACCLVALVVIGLIRTRWNGDFIGGDLLWLAMLFFTTGVLSSSKMNILVTTKCVLNVVSIGIALEKTCVSIHLIYQSATFSDYVNPRVLENDAYVGQIVLHSCQCLVLFGEFLTATVGAVIFGRHLIRTPFMHKTHSTLVHTIFSVGTLLYGVVMTGCYVVFELGKWRFNEVPLEVPFYRLSNGPLALCVFVVQVLCAVYQPLLLSATILQIVVSSLALFVINSAITNVYYIQILLENEDFLNSSSDQHTILIVALVLAATAALCCVLCTFCGVISILRSSYIMHRRHPGSESTAVAPLEDVPYALNSTMTSSPMPFMPTAVQPMEEQTLYWSAEENPYVYKSTKRYYGQPYFVDTGYYGNYRRSSMDEALNRSIRIASLAPERQTTSTQTLPPRN